MTDAILRLAALRGVLPRYTDMMEELRATSAETALALLTAMGVEVTDAEAQAEALEAEQARRVLPPYVICALGEVPEVALPPGMDWALEFEDGTVTKARGALPALPLGLHRLRVAGEILTLLSAPKKLPEPPKCWGMIVPLAGLRTATQGGLGDYRDLAELGAGLGGLGASYLGINPVHAGFPTAPGGFSPYTPSHRRRLSALHLPVAGDALGGSLIDYTRELPRRMSELRAQYDASGPSAAFDAYRAREGDALLRFATHQALSELHGPYWCDWPEALQDPASDAVGAAQQDLGDAIGFHCWIQWQAETALRAANARAQAGGMAMGLYLDLAVGTHPFGAETWEDRGSFAFGASLGAPPDAFSKDGQAWGLAPFDPHALIASGFKPLAETLRRQLSLCGVLRIDHILGFERAYWVPEGAPGGYVQMPTDAMLAVARIEATRAGAVIVGEDLGNIPDGLQASLAASGVLGCRVMMFEKDDGPPLTFRAGADYDAGTIASFSTHDLPTWAGWRKGAEIDARAAIGDITEDVAQQALGARADEVAALDTLVGTAANTPDAMHSFLAKCPARLVALQIENILEIEAQPNLPGTVDTYPNWRQRLPLGADAIALDDRVGRAAQIMAKSGR